MAEEQPPTLPPHLDNVILNSSMSKEDNRVLPVPNHVVLNHLYACSIRDGVMAVAGTTRYRKKVKYNNTMIAIFMLNHFYQKKLILSNIVFLVRYHYLL